MSLEAPFSPGAPTRRLVSLAFIAALSACSTLSSGGRTQFLVPSPVSDVYSAVDMRTQLALSSNAAMRGGEHGCETAAAFRARVHALGSRLAAQLGTLQAPLRTRRLRFAFIVEAKRDALTLSSGSGTIIVADGIRQLCLEDPALAFVIAREMGHVIARHHEEDTATGIFLSLLSQILLPFGTSAVASFAGTRAVQAGYRPDQRRESDAIALVLMKTAGWGARSVNASFATYALKQPRSADRWNEDLRASLTALDRSLSPVRESLAKDASRKPELEPGPIAVRPQHSPPTMAEGDRK